MVVKFSVLLSVYTKEVPSNLNQCLAAVFTQTHPANEVVLVEDGPLTPDLYDVIDYYKANHSELKIVKLPKNCGLGVALNEGLSHCSYEWVARTDTDDICKPNRFERQVDFLSKHLEYDLVSAWADEFINDTSNVVNIKKVPETHDQIYQYCKHRSPVNHSVVMYRKESVLKVGGYLTEYFPEDYFLWIRMLMNGARFYNIQESLLFFRYSPDTIKKRGGWKYAIGEIHIQKRIYDMGFISFSLFVRNSFLRFFVRILPLKVRSWVYETLLRDKK